MSDYKSTLDIQISDMPLLTPRAVLGTDWDD